MITATRAALIQCKPLTSFRNHMLNPFILWAEALWCPIRGKHIICDNKASSGGEMLTNTLSIINKTLY